MELCEVMCVWGKIVWSCAEYCSVVCVVWSSVERCGAVWCEVVCMV